MAGRVGRVGRLPVAAARAGDVVRTRLVLTRSACIVVAVLTGVGASAAGVPRAAVTDAPATDRLVTAGHHTARRSGTAQPGTTPADAAAGFRSVRTYRQVAVPVRLRIPSLGVDTRLQRLGLAADGTIAAPTRWETAGWYGKGPRPGQPGPAIIVGHVDSRSGPAVFFRLAQVSPGAAVLVDRADGSTASFRVSGRQQVAKSQFPADLVYSPQLQTVLRLVTCGGVFDTAAGHYRDNIIVTAVPG